MAFDAPFFGLAAHLPDRHAQNTVIVARATAAPHAPGDHERISWERDGLSALAASGGHVAATSRHIRKHLTGAYGIPDESITDLINGLIPGETMSCSAQEGCELLPPGAGRGFLLAYGRAELYKGFDDLLNALPIVNQTRILVPHLVLGAVTDEARGEGPGRPGITAYQRYLADRIERENLDVTLRTGFDPRFRDLLAHPALAAVIVPSRQEPFGRIPLEAYRAHGRTGQPGVTGRRYPPRDHRQSRSAAAATRPGPERHRRALRLPRQHPVVLRGQGTVGLAGWLVHVARRGRGDDGDAPLPRNLGCGLRLEFRRLAPPKDARGRQQGGHVATVGTPAIGIGGAGRELVNDADHPHLRIGCAARTVYLLIAEVRA